MDALEFTPPYLKSLMSRRATRWLMLLVVWSIVGFLSAAHWHLFYVHNHPYTWWELLRIKAFLWYFWGAWTLMILWFGRRFRPEGERQLRNLVVLIVGSVVITST